jgi:DNA topoisomerase VI subunit B
LSAWPLVIVKELVDNALDACEEAGIRPRSVSV